MKSIDLISGTTLSGSQMRNLKGGAQAPKACGNSCSVEGHANYSCNKDAMGDCVCGGTVNGTLTFGTCSQVDAPTR